MIACNGDIARRLQDIHIDCSTSQSAVVYVINTSTRDGTAREGRNCATPVSFVVSIVIISTVNIIILLPESTTSFSNIVITSAIDIASIDIDCSTIVASTVVYVVITGTIDIASIDIDCSTIVASTVVYVVITGTIDIARHNNTYCSTSRSIVVYLVITCARSIDIDCSTTMTMQHCCLCSNY